MKNYDLALEELRDRMVVGLGTGRAATQFVQALGERVRKGLRIRGVATSETTARLATGLGIPVVALDDVESIDVTVDGADEVDGALHLIKGYGGALLREKITAAASRKLVILVGAEKLVPVLGSRGRLPVEVIPFGRGWCARRLAAMGLASVVRQEDGKDFVTDNGNLILDCAVGPIADPAALDRAIRDLPGVVTTGIFPGMADLVLVQDDAGVRTLARP